MNISQNILLLGFLMNVETSPSIATSDTVRMEPN